MLFNVVLAAIHFTSRHSPGDIATSKKSYFSPNDKIINLKL